MAQEKRDYYEVLGVSKDASIDDIKSAYKKMALKWHPDRWVNGTEQEKKSAEEKFKEASEAYSVLSDPDKKAKYDRFGFAGVGSSGGPDFSGGFGNLNDILNDLFGGSFGFNFGGGFSGFSSQGQSSGGRPTFRGRDIRTRIKLTLEEIAKGVTKEVTIERNETCPECGGKGTKNSSDIQTCPHCKGSGQQQRVANTLFGQSITYTTCPYCNGEGRIVKNPCRTCSGNGVVRKRVSLKVNIPAGVEDGTQLKMTGEGHKAKNNGINGDLLLVIEEAPHQDFLRDGANLFYTKYLSVTEAILGTEVNIPCLDGAYRIKVEPGTQFGTVVRLRGKGLPQFNGYSSSSKGDLYVKYLVWVPKRLSRSEKDALEAMKDSETFRPNPSREDKAIFDKQKNIF